MPNFLLLLRAHPAHEDILNSSNGSAFLEISIANFRPVLVDMPPTAIFRTFDRVAGTFYSKIVSNKHESRTLPALRDALLPKLIPGDLRVPEAHGLVYEVINETDWNRPVHA